MKVLGIDPGLYGAIATWNGRILHVADVPIVPAKSRGNEINLPALVDIIDKFSEPPFLVAFIERSGVRPQEGIASAHKNGLVSGILLGCVATHCRNIVRPTPTKWKKAMGLTADKNYSRTKAIEIFPSFHHRFRLKKHHGRAEAALLAYYGFQQQNIRPRLQPWG